MDTLPVLSDRAGAFQCDARTTPAEPGAVAFLSTLPPQRCGLATFTSDLMRSVHTADPAVSCRPIAITDDAPAVGLPSGFAIPRLDRPAYRRAAEMLNETGTALLCVQHEYGIFGGADGEWVLDLLRAVRAPLAVTLHTVLDQPSRNQRRVMDAMLDRAARVVAMTQRSAELVATQHGVGPDRLRVIPHGIPDAPAASRAACRAALDLGDRPMLLTFGLLSPGKGIEHAIRALPALARRWPDILYLVVGVTHPNLLRDQGEAYREHLLRLAGELGVAGNIRFVNRFVDLPELMQALTAADVYLTPYVNEAQSVSGTLSYSYGIGTPVVSTPYHHAAELLADGRGTLVPFCDPPALAAAVSSLLADPARLNAMRAAAERDGQRMQWSNVGARYLDMFCEVAALRLPAPGRIS